MQLWSRQDAGIEPTLVGLILSPDEALRPDARCPWRQRRLTDDLIGKSYDAAARMACIGNSMSHLVLALSQTLQSPGVEPSVQALSEASLRAFAYMSRELGRVMSSLTLARCQIWLAQSPLSEPSRKVLCSLPVVPGQLFGPAVQQALERSLLVTQVRQQFAGLRHTPVQRQRPYPGTHRAQVIPQPVLQLGPPPPRGFRRPVTRQTSGHRPSRSWRAE